jgi:hypothetical protein
LEPEKNCAAKAVTGKSFEVGLFSIISITFLLHFIYIVILNKKRLVTIRVP